VALSIHVGRVPPLAGLKRTPISGFVSSIAAIKRADSSAPNVRRSSALNPSGICGVISLSVFTATKLIFSPYFAIIANKDFTLHVDFALRIDVTLSVGFTLRIISVTLPQL
jgi:hypothetical protein